MKRVIILALLMGTAVLVSSCATREHAQTGYEQDYFASATAPDGSPEASPAVADDLWPVRFSDGGTSYTVFEPQCDSWDGHQLMARSAVAVQPAGQAQPTYGVVSFSAITLVDKTKRTATLANFKVTSADFPSAREQTQNYLAAVVQNFPKRAPVLALDHLENSLTLADQPKAGRLNNTPPKIIVATRPAVLVYIDGPPAWRPVAGTGLERVINTRMLLLKDSSGHFYLHLFDGYLQASSLDGPWTVAAHAPAGAATAEKLATDSGQADLMPGTPDPVTHKTPSLGSSPVPDVFVATTPSELIAFSGQPEYASISGTDLLYAVNTSGNVFKSLTDQQNYILISGRWYRAPSLNGPWQFVPGNQLPHDFENIPDASPKENVKASVPGTPQAEEALIANSIPQSAAVARTGEMPAPQLDGAPQLAPIEGTPLHYVVNSATPIIEQDPQSWYACQDGVWYASSSVNGPWAVATFIPPVIYTIPPDSPLHYLTYVQIYGSTPDAVYEGYTPGYLGTEVADDGTVVYGTGYDYNPWIGTEWYGPPVTWGWGFDDCWTPWWGWGFDCGFGWGWGWGWGGFFPPYPCWGGYRDWHGRGGDGWRYGNRGNWANTGADFYHHGGRFAGNGFNRTAQPGWRTDYGHAYNSRTGLLAAGQRARVQSVAGSAWNPAGRSDWAHNSYGFAANNGARNNWIVSPSRSTSSGGLRSGSGTLSRSYDGRYSSFGAGGYPSRGSYNYSMGNFRGGNNFNARPQSGGWGHSIGSFFHGGGGGFHGGGGRGAGGGFHGGGGGGGGHGGGGGGHGGGGHGGGGGGHGGR